MAAVFMLGWERYYFLVREDVYELCTNEENKIFTFFVLLMLCNKAVFILVGIKCEMPALCPHPQPLSQVWERGADLSPLLPVLGEGGWGMRAISSLSV
jgi:hypothetical protein